MEEVLFTTTPLLVAFRIFFMKREEMNESGEFVEKIYEIYPTDLLN